MQDGADYGASSGKARVELLRDTNAGIDRDRHVASRYTGGADFGTAVCMAGNPPQAIRCDNGPEFTSEVFVEWCQQRDIIIRYIQPGKPNQNAYIERFNRTYREEVLNSYLFEDLDDVREITADWLISYNEQRPHDALGGLPPAIFREQTKQENSTLELST